jgi:PAS domain S-box-containing protein
LYALTTFFLGFSAMSSSNPSPHDPYNAKLPDVETSPWTLWQWFVEPEISIQEAGDRRQVRLLATSLLILIPFITTGAIMSWHFIRVPAVSGALAINAVALTLAYALSRTQSYRFGAMLAIVFISIIPFAPFLLNSNNSPERIFRSLSWIVMTVLLGNLFLSTRGLAIVIVANWLMLAFLPMTQTSIEVSSFILVVSFVTVISLLTLVAARHRNLIERDRLAELSATNRELDTLRASLEQQVEARTAELGRRTLELEETEIFLNSIIDTLPAVLFVKDAHTFTYIQWNKAAEELFGFEQSEMLGKSDAMLFPPEQARQFRMEDEHLINDRKTLEIGEEQVQTRLKGQRVLHTRKVLITSADGAPRYILGFSEDITTRKQTEAARAESEALFRALFEHSPDAVILIDPHDAHVSWPIVDCNAVACQMNGYMREELVGQSIDILNIAPGTEPEREAYMQNLRGAGQLKLEVFHRHKDGTIFSVEVSTSLIAIGEHELVLGIDRDITERKQVEETLRRQNSYLAAVHETTLGLLSRLDLNSLLEDILSRAALLAETPHGYIYLLDAEAADPEMEVKVGIGLCTEYIGLRIKPGEGISGLAWRTGLPQVVNDYDQWSGRLPKLEQGNFFSIVAIPLTPPSQGIIGIMGLAYDTVSGRMFGYDEIDMLTRIAQLSSLALDNTRMYTAIKEYAAESTALYHAAAQLLDPGADLLALAEQITKAVTREFALSNCSVLLLDETGTALRRIATAGDFQVTGASTLSLTGSGLTVAAARSGEAIYAADVLADPRYLARDSRTRSELVMPLKNQTGVIGVLDLQSSEPHAFDARAQRIISAFAKHAELALENARLVANLAQAYRRLQDDQEQLLAAEKMASLGRLTAGIAHEMNTPLAAVRSALTEIDHLIAEYQVAVGDPEITPEDHLAIALDLQKAARLANSSAERAAAFVRSIKSQTRDSSTGERFRFKVVPVLKDTLLLLGHALRLGKCTATFEAEAENLELIGAPGRLAQVLTNLVTNAIDASAGKIGSPIQVRLKRTSGGLELQVSDAGTGIPLELRSKIFEPMFTTKPLGLGTGLGLTIIHDIVTGDFGGSVAVASQLDQGTTFTLYFPTPQETSI